MLTCINQPTVEIRRGGIMISGILDVTKRIDQRDRQRWWCLVGTLDDLTTSDDAAYAGLIGPKRDAVAERRHAAEIGRTMVNHYARRRG